MDTAELEAELHERLEKLPIQPNPALARAARERAAHARTDARKPA